MATGNCEGFKMMKRLPLFFYLNSFFVMGNLLIYSVLLTAVASKPYVITLYASLVINTIYLGFFLIDDYTKLLVKEEKDKLK